MQRKLKRKTRKKVIRLMKARSVLKRCRKPSMRLKSLTRMRLKTMKLWMDTTQSSSSSSRVSRPMQSFAMRPKILENKMMRDARGTSMLRGEFRCSQSLYLSRKPLWQSIGPSSLRCLMRSLRSLRSTSLTLWTTSWLRCRRWRASTG